MPIGPVLIVDDSEDLRDGLALLLRSNGYEVVCASGGDEAGRLLRAGVRPCVIVLDLYMPEGDGFSFRERQLVDPALARIPTIVISGAHDAVRVGASIRADAAFRKPVDMDVLVAAVSRFCQPD